VSPRAEPRVALRPLAWRDRKAFLAAVRASRALHRGWVEPPATSLAFAGALRSTRDRHARFVAIRRSDGAFAGVVNLNEIVRGSFQCAYLGYWANAPLAGQGYLREAVGLALDRAFGSLALHRVEANVQPANQRSLALLQSLGFRREGHSPKYLKIAGRWRDHDRFALLREEWRRQRR
jgi:ribosomal-protein-alanine N-acetyltransferase